MISCPFSSKPKWERRKDARPQELLDAALDHFVQFGYAATKLDAVAKSAGVSKGTLYLYFCSKEELFKAVVRETIVPMIGQAEGVIDQFTGSSEDLFRSLMTTWWENVGDSKLSGLPKLMMAEAGNFPEVAQFYQEEVVERGERLMMRVMKRGMERGEIRELDLELAPRIMISPVIMMMMWKHSSCVCRVEPEKLKDYLNYYIDMSLHSILIKKT